MSTFDRNYLLNTAVAGGFLFSDPHVTLEVDMKDRSWGLVLVSKPCRILYCWPYDAVLGDWAFVRHLRIPREKAVTYYHGQRAYGDHEVGLNTASTASSKFALGADNDTYDPENLAYPILQTGVQNYTNVNQPGIAFGDLVTVYDDTYVYAISPYHPVSGNSTLKLFIRFYPFDQMIDDCFVWGASCKSTSATAGSDPLVLAKPDGSSMNDIVNVPGTFTHGSCLYAYIPRTEDIVPWLESLVK